MSETATPVPGHINELTRTFCTREGLVTEGGRCPDGCDHADHYSNDGHPECEDNPMTAIEITHLYCKASGAGVGQDSTTHHLAPRSAGGGLQILRCRYCGRSTREILDAVARDGLECGGRPGDDLHHLDGIHRSTSPTSRGRDLERFEDKLARHYA